MVEYLHLITQQLQVDDEVDDDIPMVQIDDLVDDDEQHEVDDHGLHEELEQYDNDMVDDEVIIYDEHMMQVDDEVELGEQVEICELLILDTQVNEGQVRLLQLQVYQYVVLDDDNDQVIKFIQIDILVDEVDKLHEIEREVMLQQIHDDDDDELNLYENEVIDDHEL